MKHHRISALPAIVSRQALLIFFIVFAGHDSNAQPSGWKLERMPEALETDFALSSLPSHIRDGATVYLLDPEKGYYVSRQGKNGFICFVLRTEWERGEFRQDLASPISYDVEGTRTIFPVFSDVAAMRATGKFTASQIKDIITERFTKGIYTAPVRHGISYMVSPVMRSYDGPSNNVITMCLPHYMFYAPYVSESDIGGNSMNGGPMILGDGKSPHGYIIIPAGATEKMRIMEENKMLLKRLKDYKPYFSVEAESGHH